MLVDAQDYSVNLGSHEFLSDVPSIGRIAVSTTLTGRTTTGGVADADDVTFTAVTGDQSELLVVYKDTGTEGSSPLIAYIDTATGLPITPSGGDITVVWSNGSNKIFKL